MPSDADFSRIHKLMEIERLYDELQARHQSELDEREGQLRAMREQLQSRTEEEGDLKGRLSALEEEKDRAVRALEAQRAEYDKQIERLQARVRELSNDKSPQSSPRGGLFRR